MPPFVVLQVRTYATFQIGAMTGHAYSTVGLLSGINGSLVSHRDDIDAGHYIPLAQFVAYRYGIRLIQKSLGKDGNPTPPSGVI